MTENGGMTPPYARSSPSKLGKRTLYALLLALVCANVLVRFPRGDHETGVDSFFVHNLATVISNQGRLPWVLNSLGYFGWYPLSYPAAGPLIISGLAQTTGITEEGSILALAIFYGIVGALAAFAMARAFRNDDLFAFAAALIFSLAPRFTSFTLWSASTRNLFIVLIPVFLWALVRTYRVPKFSNAFVLVSVLTVLLATHRLTILLAVVMLAFVAAFVFIVLNRVVRVSFPRALLAPAVRVWTPRLALLSILAVAVFMLATTQVLEEYAKGEICSGGSVGDQLCNLGVSITRSVGLALPLALFGVFVVVRERNKGFQEAFLVFALLALIPTLFLRQYTGFYVLPFLAVFAAYGIVGLKEAFGRNPRVRNAIVVASLVAVSGFAVAVLQVEVERSSSISSSNYATALYLGNLPPGNFVANDGLLAIQVASISGRGGLPVGGAGTTRQSPELLIMGAYSPSYVFDHERKIPLINLTIDDDSPFILEGVDALRDWQTKVLFRDVDSVTNETILQFGLRYYLENDAFRSSYTAFDETYRGNPFSTFIDSVYAKRFKLYDGTTEDLYLAFPSGS